MSLPVNNNIKTIFSYCIIFFISMFQSKVVVGDFICFSMPLESPTGTLGLWSSDNSQIISLDHDSGLGRARVPGGPVYVKYHLADHVVSSTEVEVIPISSVKTVFLVTKSLNIVLVVEHCKYTS